MNWPKRIRLKADSRSIIILQLYQISGASSVGCSYLVITTIEASSLVIISALVHEAVKNNTNNDWVLESTSSSRIDKDDLLLMRLFL